MLSRLRHAGRLVRDLVGHWRHNGRRWPLVALLLLIVLIVAVVV